MKHFEVMRMWHKKLGIQFLRQVTHSQECQCFRHQGLGILFNDHTGWCLHEHDQNQALILHLSLDCSPFPSAQMSILQESGLEALIIMRNIKAYLS